MAADIVLDLRADKVVESVKQGKRLDGRKFDEYRKITIKHNISENADGSARVTLGETDVIAGVKIVPGDPFPDSPKEGSISVGIEFLPLASPLFETGPPGSEETELARVVDRGIRESKCIDFGELCIEEGKKVWVAYIDMYTMNDDGNLFDASSIAALAALTQARIPKLEIEGDSYKIVKGEYAKKLGLARKPLLCTTTKIAGHLVNDACFAEEKAMEARFSVATTEDGYMSAYQKGGSGSFTAKEIDECIDLAFAKAKEIRKLL
ncbi:MAG: exosome complex protein Rrp42 [Candidatus ainarchaeum sp.]|nr:exosome complex protein Rrp42 [Candidatus ainarchaeum sp.]